MSNDNKQEAMNALVKRRNEIIAEMGRTCPNRHPKTARKLQVLCGCYLDMIGKLTAE